MVKMSKGKGEKRGAKGLWLGFRRKKSLRERMEKKEWEREGKRNIMRERKKWLLKSVTCHVLVGPGVLCWLVKFVLLLVLKCFDFFSKILWRGHMFKLTLRVLSICNMYRFFMINVDWTIENDFLVYFLVVSHVLQWLSRKCYLIVIYNWLCLMEKYWFSSNNW